MADQQGEAIARSHALVEGRRMLMVLDQDVEPREPFFDVLATVFSVALERIEASLQISIHMRSN